jgi:glutaredoxin
MKNFKNTILLLVLLVASATSANAHCVQQYIWMFSQPGCFYCNVARDLLWRNGIQILQTSDQTWFAREFGMRNYSDYMRSKFGRLATPMFEVDGKIIIGYNEQQLREYTCSYN